MLRCRNSASHGAWEADLRQTSFFTAEFLLRDFRWRDLHSENNNCIIIFIPTLHGKHNFEYVHCCPALLFLLWLHTAPNVRSRSCSVIAVKSTIFHVGATVADITPSNRHPWLVSPLAGGKPCKHPEENQVNLPNPIKFQEIYTNHSESNKFQANLSSCMQYILSKSNQI